MDLAEQQGHQNCVRVLRELEARTRTPTRTRADPQEPEPEPKPGSEWCLCGWGCLASDLALRVSVCDIHALPLFLFHD